MPYSPSTRTDPAASEAADRQALNEQRYKRYIEHLAGFAPGESDLPDEEIMRRRAQAQESSAAESGSRGSHPWRPCPGPHSSPYWPGSWPLRA